MNHSEKTAQLVNLVARVHGPRHPQLAEVKSLFHEVNQHYPELNDIHTPSLEELKSKLARIRELSNDFHTPADGCEGYQMMDASLAKYEEVVLSKLGG
ncbi:hypothetical protein COCCU_04285 [Corynebacterium occultum]|uniref:Uncharacterized protein n=1 Tax=Corynebacterium occultum TaxID=2675219 RepID=A0A6B8W669_9CORY|nr:hypothetical protein [Corynebacterium occultum]QGU06805.1 hypothetical protein COCCU_04285 [Corynebacterium occultum]